MGRKSKLSEEKLQQINYMHQELGYSQTKIAEVMALSQCTVSKIVNGQWKLKPPSENTGGRFTVEQIQDIRYRLRAGLATQWELAEEYKTHQSYISMINCRKVFKDVPPGEAELEFAKKELDFLTKMRAQLEEVKASIPVVPRDS